MNKWKVLKIDDLPSDILVGNYEFDRIEDCERKIKDLKAIIVLRHLTILNDEYKYRYRKIRQKAPTNRVDVIPYIDERLKLICLETSDKTISWWKGYQEAMLNLRVWVLSQQADIPPEEE